MHSAAGFPPLSQPMSEQALRLGILQAQQQQQPATSLLFPVSASLQRHIPHFSAVAAAAPHSSPFQYLANSFNRVSAIPAAAGYFPYHPYQTPFPSTIVDSLGMPGGSISSAVAAAAVAADRLNTSAFRPFRPSASQPAIATAVAATSTTTESPNTAESTNSDNLVQALKTFLLPQPSVDGFNEGFSPAKSACSVGSDTATKDTSTCSTTFDGTAVLCQVCGDKASGYHYGVHACEGCKGFFRRSIQQKIHYRPCSKNQQCSIQRINRNRCQYCRLKKCIAVGMSRDAVRFGRVPKKEKQKIIAEMQRANAKSQADSIGAELDDQDHLVTAVITAHLQTSRFIRDRLLLLPRLAADAPMMAATVACPLNPRSPSSSSVSPSADDTDLSERYSPAIRGVVDFAKAIPGFHILSQEDQVTLLKAGMFEVLLLRLSVLFDGGSQSMMLLDGSVYRRDAPMSSSQSIAGCSSTGGNGRFLVDSLFDFVQRFNSFQLNDADVAMFSAVVLVSPDRPGLRNPELVERMQFRLKEALAKVLLLHHPTHQTLFNQLLMKMPDLRTLNTLHQEKLLSFKVDHQLNTGAHHHRHLVKTGSDGVSDTWWLSYRNNSNNVLPLQQSVRDSSKDSMSGSSRNTRTPNSCITTESTKGYTSNCDDGIDRKAGSQWSTVCKAGSDGCPAEYVGAIVNHPALLSKREGVASTTSASLTTPLKIEPPSVVCPVITTVRQKADIHWPSREASSFDSGKGTLSNKASSSDSDDTDEEQQHRLGGAGRPSLGPKTIQTGHRLTTESTNALSALKQALEAPPIIAASSAGQYPYLFHQPHPLMQPPLSSTNRMNGSLRERHQAVASLLESTPIASSTNRVRGGNLLAVPAFVPGGALPPPSTPLNSAATMYAYRSPPALTPPDGRAPPSRRSAIISPAHLNSLHISPKRQHSPSPFCRIPNGYDEQDDQPLNLSKKANRNCT